MTDSALSEVLEKIIRAGDGYYQTIVQLREFQQQVYTVLSAYKSSGGDQASAQHIVEEIVLAVAGNASQEDVASDILEIIAGECPPDIRVWAVPDVVALEDGLWFEDGESSVLFNHFSFCELIKHTMVKYGGVTYDVASERVNSSHLVSTPRRLKDVAFLTQELDYHWAMLLVHGDLYWTKGIPSSFNGFEEAYFAWRSEVLQAYHLKEPYRYSDRL